MVMENLVNGQGDGFGQSQLQELEELNKALGTGTEGEAYGDYEGDMSALRPQSLERTLKVVTAQQQHIKFWNRLDKKKAYNTVEEFNVLDSHGGDSSPFFMEGGLPGEEDSHWVRRSQLVKYLGTTRTITHPATLVRNVSGDIVAQQTKSGTLWLLQQLERALYFGDSDLNPLSFDGLLKQVQTHVEGKDYESQHVIDLRGNPIDENNLEDWATIIADNYGGQSLDLHLTNQAHKDFSKILYARQRMAMPAQGGTSGNGTQNDSGGIMMGQPVRGYAANTANINFMNNVFLKPEGAPKSKSAKGSPATPAAGATPVSAVADVTSKMDAGTYYYFVSAKNNAGESTPVALGSVAVADGQAVELGITRVTSDPPATSYKVYRGLSSDPAQALFAFEVKDAGAGAEQTITDRNFDIPGTDTAFLVDNNPEEVLRFKQLAPLMKLPLARISAAERFMILLYGMLQVYNPRRTVVVKNIGKLGINSNRDLFGPTYGMPSYGTIRPVNPA